MEYYLAMRKKETLPFVTICMDLEGITKSDRQRKTNTVWYRLYVESKKSQTHRKSRMAVTRGGGWGTWRDFSQSVQTSTGKTGKFWECYVQHADYS